jgi:tRNA modification GTPase
MNDTVVALATPRGESAIAVIRISGTESLPILKKIFGKKCDHANGRVMCRGVYESLLGSELDDVMFVFFREPSSYTGEDSAEIYTHGNMVIVSKILEDLCARGCRLADRGEFTRRAFLNGKLDLCQAEAVADLIHASSEAALVASRKQLSGGLGEKLRAINEELLSLLAIVEAHIDFLEETVDGSAIVERLNTVVAALDALIGTHRYRSILNDGLDVAIVGAPNAGKSSLLNCLLDTERALVSPIAGTTRDFIVERTMLGGYLVNLCDTAGMRTAVESELELRGIGKSLEWIRHAGTYLLVLDSASPYPDLGNELLGLLNGNNCLVLENKTDLPHSRPCDDFLPHCEHARVSTLRNPSGVTAAVKNFLAERNFLPENIDIAVNGRHVDILNRARNEIISAARNFQVGLEFAAADVRNSLEILGEMVGRYDSETMLDKLFSGFCIGK